MGKAWARKLTLLALAAAALAVAGCGGDDDDSSTDGSGDAGGQWAGTFKSTFGELSFEAEGDQVTGSYEYCGGELDGIAEGTRLTGEWTEDPDACSAQQLRGESTETEGTFDFTIAADGDSFNGNWRYASGAKDPDGDDWVGKRISEGSG